MEYEKNKSKIKGSVVKKKGPFYNTVIYENLLSYSFINIDKGNKNNEDITGSSECKIYTL